VYVDVESIHSLRTVTHTISMAGTPVEEARRFFLECDANFASFPKQDKWTAVRMECTGGEWEGDGEVKGEITSLQHIEGLAEYGFMEGGGSFQAGEVDTYPPRPLLYCSQPCALPFTTFY
jgi:hypothetical protein